MRKPLLLLGIAILTVASMLQGCDSGENNSDTPIELKLNFLPGAKYQYSKTSKEVLEPETKKPAFLINQDKITETTCQVFPENNNNKKITFSFDRIAIKAGNNNVIALEYDSRDATQQKTDIFNNIARILHKPYSVTINKNGAIVHIDQPSATADSTQANNMSSQLGFSNSSINATVQELFNIYPDGPVKPGESWSKKSNTTIGFINVNADNNYKLLSADKGIAHIEMNATLSSIPADSADVKMRGVQTGTLDVDMASGLIIAYKLTSHMNGDMKLGINAATSLSSEITITGKKL